MTTIARPYRGPPSQPGHCRPGSLDLVTQLSPNGAFSGRAEELGRLNAFKGVDERQLRAILPCLLQRIADSGDVLSGDGELQQKFVLVWSGAHRATIMSPSGQHITIRVLKPNDHFGEFAIFSGAAQPYYHIVSDSPGLLLQMAASDFTRLIDESPSFRRNILASMSREALLCADRIFEFAALNGRVRLQAELLRLCGSGAEGSGAVVISPAPTHEALASQIGVTREGVTRYFKSLSQQGLVRCRRRGQIEVLDVARLRAAVERDAGRLLSYDRTDLSVAR